MIFFSTVRFCEVSYFINFFIRPMLERSIKSINQKTPKGQSVLKVLKLPILDMESQDLGDKLEANFKSIGFAIVVNHGIS